MAGDDTFTVFTTAWLDGDELADFIEYITSSHSAEFAEPPELTNIEWDEHGMTLKFRATRAVTNAG